MEFDEHARRSFELSDLIFGKKYTEAFEYAMKFYGDSKDPDILMIAGECADAVGGPLSRDMIRIFYETGVKNGVFTEVKSDELKEAIGLK